MSSSTKIKDVKAAAEATMAVAVMVAVVTIGGELWAPLKDTLKMIFTHHWLGKGALAVVLFTLVYYARRRSPASNEAAVASLYHASIVCLLSSVAMLIFFVTHFFHLV